MPKPIRRKELIRKLKHFGFEGPFSGRHHFFMRCGNLKVRIPNEHGSDISEDLVARILKQANISKGDWDKPD
ncbi:MAG TPA: hypothetical protein DCK87_09095 [Desulfotomaculum sp.]|nr:hypothetical protein [Desulfotomaculum sp.]